MRPRTAVIPAAGFGTRFLPATKAVPKMMLPLIDRPLIQYAVEEAARVDIERIVIVTSRGTDAVEAHFEPAPALEAALEAKGRDDLLHLVRSTSGGADVTFVYQDDQLGLGHAVGCAADVVGDDPFAVLLPDEVMHPEDGLLEALVDACDRYDASVIAVMEMPRSEISSYGVVEPEWVEERLARVLSFVEKPPPEEAPSNLGSIGRYVLTRDVMDAISSTVPGAGGEIQLTDAIASVAASGEAYAYVYRGRRWDVGTPAGHVRATADLAAERDDLR